MQTMPVVGVSAAFKATRYKQYIPRVICAAFFVRSIPVLLSWTWDEPQIAACLRD
jgi:hypothetical protein